MVFLNGYTEKKSQNVKKIERKRGGEKNNENQAKYIFKCVCVRDLFNLISIFIIINTFTTG